MSPLPPEIERQMKTEMHQNYVNWLMQLYPDREKILTIISGLAVAFLGVGLALSDRIKDETMALTGIGILLIVTLTSLWRYIQRTNEAIIKNQEKMLNIWDADLTKPIQINSKKDHEIEIYYFLFAVGVILFVFSFLEISF